MALVADDPLELHRVVRELVALSTLPAAWRGTPTARIPDGLADILLKSLAGEFAFVRVASSQDGAAIEALRQHGGDDAPMRMAVQQIGADGGVGFLVVGSRRPEFPTEIDSLLLEVAANQTAMILQQRLAEERLHVTLSEAERSAEQLRLALEAGRFGIGELMFATGEVTSSPRQEAIFGLAPGTHTSDDFRNVIHPEDCERVVREYTEAIERLEPIHTEYRIVRPDGSVRWVETHGQVLPDGNGRPGRMVGVCADITERKQNDELLRVALAAAEEATRLKDEFIATISNELRWIAAIVEHSDDAIVGKTLDGIVTSWNPGAERLYGYPATEMIGRPIRVLVPADHSDEVPELLEALKRGEAISDYETERVTKAGQRLDVSIKISPIRDASGVLIGASTIARDIGDRKRAEKKLRDLLEAAPDAMVIVDHVGQIVMVNAQVERLLGYRREELLGKRVEVLVPSARRAEHVAHRGGYLQAARPRPMGAGLELTALHRDGSEVPVEISLSPIEGDEGTMVLAAVRDVSERRQREQQLRDAEAKLAHISRVATMGELSTSIAHEVNQPLAAIVNDGAACLRWLQKDPPALAAARESVQHMIADANRASHVIARIRALLARQPPAKMAFDGGDLVRDTLAIVKAQAAGLGVAVQTQVAPDLPYALGDRVQIQQVLLNLVVNALDAMRGVRDRPRELAIDVARGGPSTVLVAVRDSGVGIAPELRDRIFEPFYTTKRDGLGMGLAISRSIVEEHGGQVWAAAHNGPGVIVQFTIPIAEEDV